MSAWPGHQRYTYLGLAIVLAMGLIAAWLIWAAFYLRDVPRYERPEIDALRMQCERKNGVFSIASDMPHTWIECYDQNLKKMWGVRL